MEKPKDSKTLLLQCIGNTCKLINVGKCPDAQPITNPAMELPLNYGRSSLPDITITLPSMDLDLDDEG